MVAYMDRAKLKLHMISYLFIVCLNAYWFANRSMLSGSRQMSIFLLSMGLFLFTLCLHCLGAKNNMQRQRICKISTWIVFIYYLYILLEVLFLGGLFGLSRASGGGGRMNLVPFQTIHAYITLFKRYPNIASITNILGNFVVFMPMAILLPTLFQAMKKWYLFFPSLGLLLTMVEAFQYFTDRGRADIDDVILNFAGAAAVYILWSLLRWVLKQKN